MTARKNDYASIAFKKRGGTYQGSAPLRDLPLFQKDPAETMRAATDSYCTALRHVKQWQREVKNMRKSKAPLTARKAWKLGDIVHILNQDLADHGCRLENLYGHLQRHAGLCPKRLSSYVTLRRYVDDVKAIPPNLKWYNIEKKVKVASQVIIDGVPMKV